MANRSVELYQIVEQVAEGRVVGEYSVSVVWK